MELRERQLAIVLLDLIGSTAFVQRVGAMKAAKWLQYHDRLTRSLLNGVQRLKRAFANRRYLITRDVWERGERASGNSLRKALGSYAWDRNDKPIKDGREDPLDALRYDCIFYNWHDTAVDQRSYTPRSKSDKKSRRVRVGGGSKQSF